MTALFQKLSERRRFFSRQKLANWALNRVEFALRRNRLVSRPNFAILETGNICNLRCPLCPTGQNLPVERGYMSMATFNRAMEQLAATIRYVSLYCQGEPMLCAHLPEMVSRAHRHGIRAVVSSNLNTIRSEQMKALISARLDYLIVSLDGASQQIYGRYRVGGDIEAVLENVTRFLRMREAAASRYPRIVIQPVVFRHNEAELPKIAALCAQLGLPVSVRQGTLGGRGHSPPSGKDRRLARKWLSPNPKYHKEYNYPERQTLPQSPPLLFSLERGDGSLGWFHSPLLLDPRSRRAFREHHGRAL